MAKVLVLAFVLSFHFLASAVTAGFLDDMVNVIFHNGNYRSTEERFNGFMITESENKDSTEKTSKSQTSDQSKIEDSTSVPAKIDKRSISVLYKDNPGPFVDLVDQLNFFARVPQRFL